jgi:hypothetical protein
VLVSWSHAGRLRSERLCRPGRRQPESAASSGRSPGSTNRLGDRQLNRALHTIVLARLRDDPTPAPMPPGAEPRARASRHPAVFEAGVARQLFKLLERYGARPSRWHAVH